MPTPYKPLSSVAAAVAVQAAVNATVITGAATNHRTPSSNTATSRTSNETAQPITCHVSYGPLRFCVRGSIR